MADAFIEMAPPLPNHIDISIAMASAGGGFVYEKKAG
jgi:hypothetical protein